MLEHKIKQDVNLINLMMSVSMHLSGIKQILKNKRSLSDDEHYLLIDHVERAKDRAERSVKVAKGIRDEL